MLIILLLLKKIETNLKASMFKVNDRVRISKYKNIFSKCYTNNLTKEMSIIDFIFKNNQRIKRRTSLRFYEK